MREKVENALQVIRPILQADGGDIELVEVVGNVAKVHFVGACSGCPMSQITLKGAVEKKIKEIVPEIESVEAV